MGVKTFPNTRCQVCQKFNKRSGKCLVMNELISDCWAWTDDKNWLRKVKEAVEEYRRQGGQV